MTDKDKVIEYELQIEDMLMAIQSNLDELKDRRDLSQFDQGRQLAYEEIIDIIKTRYSMIFDVIG